MSLHKLCIFGDLQIYEDSFFNPYYVHRMLPFSVHLMLPKVVHAKLLITEISKDLTSKPLIMLAKKDETSVKDELTIDEVKSDYLVIMIMNRTKL